MTATPGGPIYVRGTVRLVDRRGQEISTGPRTALCGCGASGNAPLCDGSHRRIGRNG